MKKKSISDPKVFGASNLQFLKQKKPFDIDKIYDDIDMLIDSAMAISISHYSEEEIHDLSKLKNDLSEKPYNDFIDLNYPRFSITPHEYAWLKCHKKEKWIEYLLYRYKFKMYPISQKLANFPVHLLIESTSVCNLRCTMCFQVDKTFSGNKNFLGVMQWDMFTSAIDQAADYNCHAITLGSRGEPTLHKRFGEMLLYIHDKGLMDIKINTNATRLTERLCHDILSSEVATVTLSVDASTKESYEKIRVNGKFENVLGNIMMFNDIREKHYPNSPTSTRIAGVAVQETQSPEEMEKFWSEHVDHVAIRKEIPRWDSYGNPMFKNDSICNLLYERIYLWYDGTCNPCDFDYKSYLAIGNANSESISEIWRGDKYQELRKKHELRQRSCIVPCDRCPF